MTTTSNPSPAPRFAPGLVRFAALWSRISARLVPILAVVTAFLFGIPVIMITVGSVGGGLSTAGVAYAALIEGATGLAINDVLSADDFSELRVYAASQALTSNGLGRQARPLERVGQFGAENLRRWEALLQTHPLSEDEIALIGENLPRLREIGADKLRAAEALFALISEAGLSRSEVRSLADIVGTSSSISDEQWEALVAVLAPLSSLDASAKTEAINTLTLIHVYTATNVETYIAALKLLDAQSIDPLSPQASDLQAIFSNNTGRVIEAFATLDMLEASGVSNAAALGEQIRLAENLYSAGYLKAESVLEALDSELPQALNDALIIRRPGNVIEIAPDAAGNLLGILQPEGEPPIAYLRLGGSAGLFIPNFLEDTIVRAIPYVIAGLAVAVGFKGGLFNIGAEGQLNIGAILAAWVGFALAGVPGLLHIGLLVAIGALGGLLWGAIPGLLKAFTGAHEVVTTIMLNFIALWLIDWLIKSRDPILLGDASASDPKTPLLLESARLPKFADFDWWVFIVAAVLVAAFVYWRTHKLNPRALQRAISIGALTGVGGIFLRLISVTNHLHIGLLFMIGAILLVTWFIERTTPGFELRAVGINQHAARYAGMSVAFNVVLAMALAGGLAGLAGAIEVAGRQYLMLPGLFTGYGFDAISVSLLARSEPTNMFFAGFLWGGLANGAPLMQLRANISIDLVRIIQALIIIFIAADQIIRYIWRIAPPNEADRLTFTTGWGR